MKYSTIRPFPYHVSCFAFHTALFLFFFALYGLTMGGHGYGGVGTTTYDVTRSIVLNHGVAITPVPWGKFGPDGRFYAQYGIGHSLYNIPWYLLGHELTLIFPRLASQYDRITMFSTLLGQPAISALTVLLLWKFCSRIGYTPRTALWCAFLYGLGTQAWMYAQLDFSEPLLTFWLLASYYWLYGIGSVSSSQTFRRLIMAGMCVGLAITVKIVAVIVLPVFVLYLWKQSSLPMRWRVKQIGAMGLTAFLTGLLPVGLYNWIRFGNVLETGYHNEFNLSWKHAAIQFWMNLAGLEGSILLYSPVILLVFWGLRQFWKRNRAFAMLIFGGIFVFFTFYPFSTNEVYYGPRYLTPTLPLFLLIVGAGFPAEARQARNTTHRRFWGWLVGILLVFGILQQLIGVLVNYHTYYWRIQYTMPIVAPAIQTSPDGQLLLATPQLPHLLGHLWLIRQAIRDLFTPGGMPIGGITILADTSLRNAWIPYYGLDVWWYHPGLIRIVGWPGIVGLVGMMVGVIVLSMYGLLKKQISVSLPKRR